MDYYGRKVHVTVCVYEGDRKKEREISHVICDSRQYQRFFSPFSRDLQVILTGGAITFQELIGEILPYEEVIIHPNFTFTSPKNDLMLIKLSVPLTFFSASMFQLPVSNSSDIADCLVYTWVEDKRPLGE